jgi:hypothetical protein
VTSPYAKPGAISGVRPTGTTRTAATRQPTAEERRRAQRVLLKMPVIVHVANKPDMEGFTHTVSASGAMIIIPEGLAQGTKLILENPKTQQKVEANVVRPPQMNQDGSLVPVEFLSPAPQFWNIIFPPNVN